MATKATSSNYWISPSALAITLNALGDPDYVQASASSGAVVLCYMNGIDGLGYDTGHNYRRWSLVASPTYFTSTTEKYLYVAIPRPTNTDDTSAHIVYPSVEVDLYGQTLEETPQQIGNENYYYISLGARITASVIGGVRQSRRDWYNGQGPVFGLLSTDEALAADDQEWYHYDSIAGVTTFLKPLIQLVDDIKSWWHQLIVDTLYINHDNLKKITDIQRKDDALPTDETTRDEILDTTIPTVSYTHDYASKNFLSKVTDDTAAGNITFEQSIDVKANANVRNNLLVKEDTRSEDFSKADIPTVGTGWQINKRGDMIAQSLVLRESLTVPEIRYNRITTIHGIQWHTIGSEKIKSVTPIDIYTGIIEVDLEDGEYASLKVDDKCMGIWHMYDDEPADGYHTGIANDDTNVDSHNGNFHFAGFKTIYFKITEEVADDAGAIYKFKYVLRCKDEADEKQSITAILADAEANYSNADAIQAAIDAATDATVKASLQNKLTIYNKWHGRALWTDATHPQAEMHIAAYANSSQAERQACEYATTTYTIQLANMTDWIYASSNIQFIYGRLSGFTIQARIQKKDASGNVYYETQSYPLSGYGIATGNIYKWGTERTLERPRTQISQQLYYYKSATVPSDFLSDYPTTGWSSTPLSPDTDNPYVYGYWLSTYIDGSTESQESSTPFLLSSYGESAVYAQWSTPVVPINVTANGWIVDDVPPEVKQYYDIQHVTVFLNLTQGVSKYLDITAITLDETPDYISSLTVAPYNGDNKTWQVDFDVHDFESSTSVSIPFVATTALGNMQAPLTLSPAFSGSDGANGSDGENPIIYEIDPSQQNFIVNPDDVEVVTSSITFSIYKVSGSIRTLYKGCYYSIQFLDESGEQLTDVTARMGYSSTGTIVVDFEHDPNNAIMAMNMYYVRCAIQDASLNELKSVTIARVTEGESGPQGPRGDDGESALSYELVPTSDYIHTNASGTATAPFGCKLYRSVGMSRAEYESVDWKVTIEKPNMRISIKEYTGSSFSLSKTEIGTVTNIVVVAYDNSTTPRTQILSRTFYPVADGAQGLQGVVVRFRGQWLATEEYFNQSESTSTGVRYVDVVQQSKDNIVSYYSPKPTADGASNQGHDPNASDHSTYWITADYYNFIATNLLLAKNASIDFLTGNAIYLRDKEGNICVGMQGEIVDTDGNSVPMIFAGATDENAATAKFRVMKDGHIYAEDGTFKGIIEATQGSMNQISIGGKGIWIGEPSGRHIIIRSEKNNYPEIALLNGESNLLTINSGNGEAGLIWGNSNRPSAKIWRDGIGLNGDQTTGEYGISLASGSVHTLKVGNFEVESSGSYTNISGCNVPVIASKSTPEYNDLHIGDVYADDQGFLRVKIQN